MAAATVLTLAAGACSSPEPDPPLPYPAVEFDLCERTDLGPLEPLSLTVWEEQQGRTAETDGDEVQFVSEPGTCVFAMRSASGHHANLEIHSYVEESRDAAETTYERRSQRVEEPGSERTPMTPVGTVDGVGDRAVAFTRERSDPVYARPPRPEAYQRYAEYRLIALTGNLVVDVHLGVGDDDVSPPALAEPAQEMAAQTIAVIPPAPAPAPHARRGKAYQVTEVEPCQTDAGPIEERLPVQRYDHEEYEEPSVGRIRCRIWLDGEADTDTRDATLTVMVAGRGSLTIADDTYVREVERLTDRRRSPWEHAGTVDAFGERADAYTRTEGVEDTDLIYSEYVVVVLDGNLVVSVELEVVGYSEVPVETLRDLTHATTRDVVDMVPLVPDS